MDEVEMPTEVSEALEETVGEEPIESSDPNEADALTELRRELAELKELVVSRGKAAREAMVLTQEFRALYPEVAEGDIPDAVWEEVRGGLALEAAYALWERRERLRRDAAEVANRKNAGGSWGRADAAGEEFLSPDEVRGMSPREVRENYSRILESMRHWS